MNTQWKINTLSDVDRQKAQELAQQMSLHPVVARLLVQRGITNPQEAKTFFAPSMSELHDPFLMPDMQKAIDRINNAVRHREKIMIYGDYDVDGTTAVSLVYKVLLNIISPSYLGYYIPDSDDEGYGISFKGVEHAANNGFTLIIALDCGIKAIDKVTYASRLGVDVIICDHHTPDDQLPQAVAVIDAKRADSVYPYPDLSGCGVGFKLMQAFMIANGMDLQIVYDQLDLVAVSIAADIVPMTGENRLLAIYGLKRLNEQPNHGLQALINICNLNERINGRIRTINVSDVIYKIGPRLNASGRMMRGHESVELLIADSLEEATRKSREIDNHNNERRELDRTITKTATELLDKVDMTDMKIIMVYNPAWHKGVIGIVASRLAERYCRPSIVLTKSNGLITGSARSYADFDIYSAIDHCREYLENFGGHPFAAGLSIKEGCYDAFKEKIERYAAQHPKSSTIKPTQLIDEVISFRDIGLDLWRDLCRMEPFGPENPKPVFCSYNVYDRASKLVGRNKEHLRIDAIDATCRICTGIAFSKGHYYDFIRNQVFSMCYHIEKNDFPSNDALQIMVKGIKISQE